jgi:hypothetical protein
VFHPVAVEDDAIGSLRGSGRSATLTQLEPKTLVQTNATELPIDAVRAVLDPASQVKRSQQARESGSRAASVIPAAKLHR